MKLSKIIQRQIPAFIRETSGLAGEKYNRFVAFLVRYYEFLETEFNKIGTVQGSSSQSSPTIIEPPVGIPGSPGVPIKSGDYFLVTSSGFFSIGSEEKKKTVYATSGNIIVFSANGASYLRNSESYNFLSNKDVSSNTELRVILNALANEMAYSLPKTLTEELLVLQRIKELYVSKGSEESFRFLFRVLFNKEIEIYYPSSSVLRTSDGEWRQDYSVLVRVLVGNPNILTKNRAEILARPNKVSVSVLGIEDKSSIGFFPSMDLGFIRQTIESVIEMGYTNQTVEQVLNVGQIEELTNSVHEVFIDRSYYGSFREDDPIVSVDENGNVFIGYILSTTASAEVFHGGKGFRVGDYFTIDTQTGNGTVLKVTEIESAGKIATIDFLKFGHEYKRPLVVSLSNTGEVRVVIEERAELDDDPSFVTKANLVDYTAGTMSRGYSLSEMDYSLDDGVVYNYVIKNQGIGYTNATVTFSDPVVGKKASGTVMIDYEVLKELSGFIRVDVGQTTVQGYLTKFSTEVAVGDMLRGPSGIIGEVQSITNNTTLILKNAAQRSAVKAIGQIVRGYISGINISDPGYGYTEPPTVTISGNSESSGAEVEALIGYGLYCDMDYCGEVVSRFSHDRRVLVSDQTENALVRLYPGPVAKYPGYYESNKGFLSDLIFLQDGRYYQDFSYVVRSDVEMSKYESYIKTTVHPSGTILFGEYDINNSFSLENDLNIINEFKRRFTINVVDDYTVSDVQQFTDVVYSHTEYAIDSLEFVDYGSVADDPYTIPLSPFAARMWENYADGDALVEFGNGVTPPPPPPPPSVAVTLDPSYSNALGMLSNGNLSWEWAWVGSYGCSYSTVPRSTGKYYFEIINNIKGGYGGAIYDNWSFNGGISTDRGIGNDVLIGTTATAWGFSNSNSSGLTTDTKLFNNSTAIDLIGVPQIPEDGYLGVAVDFDAGKIWFNANGTWVLDGNPASGTNPAYTFAPNIVAYAGVGQGSRNPFGKSTINFGATAFRGTVPAGFTAWKN